MKFIIIILFVSQAFMGCSLLKKTETASIQTKKKDTQPKLISDISTENLHDPSKSKAILIKQNTTTKKVETNRADFDKTDIEQFKVIQYKYAIRLDIEIEKINNTALFKFIDEWWGTTYCIGGNDKSCIDCSGFTKNLMLAVFGIDIPRTSKEQFDKCKRIKRENLMQGDLVFFKTKRKKISHVGIYLANNKFVHASTSNGVMISDLNEEYWKNRFYSAGRY